MKFNLGIFLVVSLISCSGDEASSSKSVDQYINDAVTVYSSVISETSSKIEQSGDVEEAFIDKKFSESKQSLLEIAHQVKDLSKAKRNNYSRKYMERVYQDLDSSMVIIITFKDSLKAMDPLDSKAFKLEELMGVSAYGDFDILRRTSPSEFEKEISK